MPGRVLRSRSAFLRRRPALRAVLHVLRARGGGSSAVSLRRFLARTGRAAHHRARIRRHRPCSDEDATRFLPFEETEGNPSRPVPSASAVRIGPLSSQGRADAIRPAANEDQTEQVAGMFADCSVRSFFMSWPQARAGASRSSGTGKMRVRSQAGSPVRSFSCFCFQLRARTEDFPARDHRIPRILPLHPTRRVADLIADRARNWEKKRKRD